MVSFFVPGLQPRSEPDKRRLYLAFFSRQRSFHSQPRYHTGILYAPQNPTPINRDLIIRVFTPVDEDDNSILDPDRECEDSNSIALCHHVRNVVVDNGIVKWKFCVDQTAARSFNIAGVVFLRKASSAISEMHIRQEPIDQSEPGWTSHNWTRAAMQALANHNLIEVPPNTTVDDVFQAGIAHLDSNFPRTMQYDKPLLTCDMKGKSFPRNFYL